MGRRGCGCCGCKTLDFGQYAPDEINLFEAFDSEDPPPTFALWTSPDGKGGPLPGGAWQAIELSGKIKPTKRVTREAYLISFKLYGAATIEVEGYKCHVDTVGGTVDMDDPDDNPVLDPGKPLPGKASIGEFDIEATVNIFVCPTHIYVYAENLHQEGYPYPSGALYNPERLYSAMIVAEPSDGLFTPSGNWSIESSDCKLKDVSVQSFEVKYATSGYDYTTIPTLDCRQTRNYACDYEAIREVQTFRSYSLKPFEASLDMEFTGQFYDMSQNAGFFGLSKYLRYDGSGRNQYEFGYDPFTFPGTVLVPKTDINLPQYNRDIGSFGTNGYCVFSKGKSWWLEYDADNVIISGIGVGVSTLGTIRYHFPEPTYANPYPLPLHRITLTASYNWTVSETGRKPDGFGGWISGSIFNNYASTSISEMTVGINALRSGFTITTSEPTADTYTLTDPEGLLDDPNSEWGPGFNQPKPHVQDNIGASGTWTLF